MIIEKISIKSFGRLTDMTLEFSPTVNVLEGENESGKSTLAAFIKYMLYGFEAESDPDSIGERQKRINWTSGTAEGSMTVNVRGKRYLITRSTVASEVGGRPTYKEESSVVDLDTGTPAFGKAPAGEIFFGVGRDLFDNTAFLGSVGDTRFSETAVRDSIENILFSGSERQNLTKAAGKVDDKMETLLHKSGNGGAIYDLVRKQEELEAELSRSDEDNRRILEKEAELHEIRERRAAAENSRERLLDLDECYKNVMLIGTFDKLHDVEREAEEKNEAYRTYVEEHTLNGFLPDEEFLGSLENARCRLQESTARTEEATALLHTRMSATGITGEIDAAITRADDLGGEGKVKERAAKLRSHRIRDYILSVASALVAIVAAVFFAAAVPPFNTPTLRIVAIVFTALGAVGAILFLALALAGNRKLAALSAKFHTTSYEDLRGKLTVIAEARAKRDSMRRELEEAEAAVAEANDAVTAARSDLSALVSRLEVEMPESNLDAFLDELTAKLRAFLDKKRELLEDKNLTELTVKEIRRALADKSEIEVRATVLPLKRKALVGINHDSIINGIAEARASIAEQERLAYDVENELTGLKARARDPGEVYSKIRVLNDRIDELRMRHKAYYLAFRTIGSVSDCLREEISPRLGNYSADLLGVMTDKKYKDVSVTDGLKVTFKDENGEDRPVDFLSGGTRDLTYIAVRMALIDMLYSEKPPVTFDESFAHQDNLRSRSMMKAICHLAKSGQQSFIFTCRAREGQLAAEFDKKAQVFKLSLDPATTL